MDKSPEAFRTISEVADFLDTPAHVLRFWESRFPQIRPVKRAGGRRYYRPSDVALLAGIKRLLHDEGMTIRGVQKILREQGIRHVSGLGSNDSMLPLDDTDIEAVLNAEYGPRDTLSDSPPPSSEALQTAQIISLETALNRPDSALKASSRNIEDQAELWPASPPDAVAEDVQAWPSDPGDVPSDDAAGMSSEDAPAEEPTVRTQGNGAEDDGMPAEADAADDTAASHVDVTEAPPLAEVADAPNSQTGTNAPAETEAVDSSVTDPPQDSMISEDAPNATVAALLRRVSPDQAAAVQGNLIRLRDRLTDLRGRVAEAARRRAK